MGLVDSLLLFTGLLFTFVVPGFLIVETFFKKLPQVQKSPLYLLVSVFVSSYLVYLVSLLLGFSKTTVLLSFSPFVFWLGVYLQKPKPSLNIRQEHPASLALGAGVFFVFLAALLPGIFTFHRDYIVMAGSNWQDTAMHLGIIQSLAEGNFPPQAPYYSGVPLDYYYFTDFHTAILSTLIGEFVPQILVVDNPFFVFTFVLSVYALGHYFTQNRLAAWLAAFLGLFNANFMFVRFINDLISQDSRQPLVAQLTQLFSRGYHMEYSQLMQMTPMVDYFLQNRPMMVGLPSVVMISLLVLAGLKEKDNQRLLLAGLLVGLLVKFQFFAVGVSLIVFGVAWLVLIRPGNWLASWRSLLAFVVPSAGIALLTLVNKPVNGLSLWRLARSNFAFSSWAEDQSWRWFLRFVVANFGLPFVIAILALVFYLIRRKRRQESSFFFVWLVLMFTIPLLVRFTIYGGDMFKFYYFMMIPVSIIAGLVLGQVWGMKIGPVVVVLVLLISSLTSFLTLANSVFNKNMAYSLEDYQAGLWIRENTPPRSVFVGLPTVHTPITQIGGRLRVLSYINWPYSHGYNHGEDNVFKRHQDLKSLYQKAADPGYLSQMMDLYQASYVYHGPEERKKYPRAGLALDKNRLLRKVYRSAQVKIYHYQPTPALPGQREPIHL